MVRIARLTAPLAFGAALSACTSVTPPPPRMYKPSAANLEAMGTIGLLSIEIPKELADAPAAGNLDPMLRSTLERAGFTAHTLSREDWQAAIKQVGGIYNPSTGELDDHQRTAAFRTMIASHDDLDGVALPRLVVETARFSTYSAWWSGTKQPPTTAIEGWANLLGGGSVSGQIRALSIALEIRDQNANLVFEILARSSPRCSTPERM